MALNKAILKLTKFISVYFTIMYLSGKVISDKFVEIGLSIEESS